MKAKQKYEAILLFPEAHIKKQSVITPFLKWAGGKSQLLPELRRFVPSAFRRYLEPFLGGGALFFDLHPHKAILNDSNTELIKTYEIVRDEVHRLVELLSTYPNEKNFFYKMRAQTPDTLTSEERAARFIYLNRTCFNGLYRVNKRNQFNVPFGTYSNPTICDANRLRSASQALKHVQLFCEDYYSFLHREAQPGDFIYADPPYHPISRYSDFKRYTQDFFYKQDQIRLAVLLKELGQRGCYILASNSDCDFIRKCYSDWEIHEVQARRNINKNGLGRGSISEVILVWPMK
jgi:DNA adenine methylase